MSYILDALKKADRERNRAKVPTLTTVHIPVLIARRRVGVWIVVGVLVLGCGLLAWMVSPLGSGSSRQADVVPQTNLHLPPERVEPAARASEKPVATAPLSPVGPPTKTDSFVESRQAGRQVDRDEAPRPRPSEPPIRQAARANPAPAGPPPADPEPADPEPDEMPPAPEPTSAETPQTPMAAPAPAPVLAPSSPTLRDILPRLRLDIFVYTDVEVDRMVVINGRRYVKGQAVEELYLLEEITPEGAVLNYRGERAVLRP
jgi:general secretion pathway protein B